MKMLSTSSMKLLFATTGLCLCLSTSQATSLSSGYAEECQLGTTCRLPGKDGGKTNFVVTPKSGMAYQCRATADNGGKIVFWVGDAKDFKLESGGGFYKAEPEVTINLSGRFKHPDDKKL